jgi:hypothetical protein
MNVIIAVAVIDLVTVRRRRASRTFADRFRTHACHLS